MAWSAMTNRTPANVRDAVTFGFFRLDPFRRGVIAILVQYKSIHRALGITLKGDADSGDFGEKYADHTAAKVLLDQLRA